MKETNKLLIRCMIINFIIGVIKITGGIVFNLSSLISDGLHTFSDFITDIISIAGMKISNQKPTKSHPFGFGRVEYLSNLLVSFILLLLGFMILYNIYNHEFVIPSINAIFVVIISIALKGYNIYSLHKRAVKTHNQILISSVQESKIDLISTFAVFFVIVLLQFSTIIPAFTYCDILCSLIISFLIFKSSFHIFFENALSIIGETEENYPHIDKLNSIISEFKEVENHTIELTKFGEYYRLYLSLKFKNHISLKHALLTKKCIEKAITRHYSLQIGYIVISISE